MPRNTAATPPKAERQKKTPEQRALENLGTTERVRAKTLDKLARARQEVRELEALAEAETKRLEYVGIHPDLPQEERDRVAAILAPAPDAPETDA